MTFTKRIFLPRSVARTFVIIAGLSAVTASAQISEQDRLARCANNRARIASLQGKYDKIWSGDHVQRARELLRQLRGYRGRLKELTTDVANSAAHLNEVQTHGPSFGENVNQLSSEYDAARKKLTTEIANMKMIGARDNLSCSSDDARCADQMITDLGHQIDQAGTDRAASAQWARDIAASKTNLIALHCDQETAGDPVVGTWTWAYAQSGRPQEHGAVTFTADGKMNWTGGSHGTWTRTGNVVSLHWSDKPRSDNMVLSADGKRLTGSNDQGWPVQGERQ